MVVAALVFVELLLPFPVGDVVPVGRVVGIPGVGVDVPELIRLLLLGGQGVLIAAVFLLLGPGEQVVFLL